MAAEQRNSYLEQVVAQQDQLEQNLRAKRSPSYAPPMSGSPAQQPAQPFGAPPPAGATSAVAQPGSAAVDVRITGFWRWKTVVVPPNAFVVHTRRGHTEPLHVGLGTSFRFNPSADAYLVVPGAMQTILISAFCICRELQGLVVQAYVQWIIQDFATAYRKLDFTDAEDPMRLVNLQLKEQAEAAIKDKVATMSVHEVLSDKQPIVEDLIERLRSVAEGEGGSDRGLGLRIVTVQIKEAIVSSARLWENLQKPFRSEQERIARLAELAAQEVIAGRELDASRAQQTQQLETQRELSDIQARNAALAFDRETAESARRAEREQQDARRRAELETETAMHALALERQRDAEELEVGRLRLEREHAMKRLALDGELALAKARTESAHESELLRLEREKIKATISNGHSAAAIQSRLIGLLPEIVSNMPKPTELKSVTIGGNDPSTVAGLVAELSGIVTALRTTTEK